MNYVERLAVIKRDMNAILDVAETEKRGLTPEEQEQFDALKNERDVIKVRMEKRALGTVVPQNVIERINSPSLCEYSTFLFSSVI